MNEPPLRRENLRRPYLDWIRGIAVLIMIGAHLLDSWTAAPYRESTVFAWAMIVGGFGGALFLYLAGVSVPLSAASKAHRLHAGGFDSASATRAASRAVARRGFEIFLLAFLFRIQSWILSGGPVRSLLKVDMLNIMGPSIAAAAALWGAAKTTRARYAALAIATIAVAAQTPPIRSLPALDAPLSSWDGRRSSSTGFTSRWSTDWCRCRSIVRSA